MGRSLSGLVIVVAARPALTVTPPRHDGHMTNQLVLLESKDVDWRLDDHTKELGRQGIAAARQALAEAVRRVAA
jgi:hypothetical protein